MRCLEEFLFLLASCSSDEESTTTKRLTLSDMKTKRKDENGVSDPFVSAVMSIALHALMDEDDEDLWGGDWGRIVSEEQAASANRDEGLEAKASRRRRELQERRARKKAEREERKRRRKDRDRYTDDEDKRFAAQLAAAGLRVNEVDADGNGTVDVSKNELVGSSK